MPRNIKIEGDDAIWKRAVDEEIRELHRIIAIMQTQILYLQKRAK